MYKVGTEVGSLVLLYLHLPYMGRSNCIQLPNFTEQNVTKYSNFPDFYK